MIEPSASEATIEAHCAGLESLPRDQIPQDGYPNLGIKAVAIRDGMRCCWCSRLTGAGIVLYNQRLRPTRDHVIPSSEGGSLHVDNLLLSCQFCNNRRGSMPAVEFLEIAERPQRRVVVRAIKRAAAHRQRVLSRAEQP